MTRLAVALVVVLATAPLAAAETFTFARAIPNPAPAIADFFGSAVALTNDTLLVGARFDDPASKTNAGAAYAFDLGSGALLTTFTGPSPLPGDQLGFAVAANGADLLAAAPDAADRKGVVYRFARTSTVAARTYSSTSPGAKLGYALAVAGADVLAGAPYEDSAGAAHLFDVNTGAHLRAIPNPTPNADDLFGRAVAIAGGILAVGAPFDDDPAANAGVVHLFTRSSGALRTTLTAPQPHPGDNFGSALSADGTHLAIGAPFADSAGTVYVFDAATGALIRTLDSPEPDARFGAAVAISAGRVLVGAPFVDTAAKDAGVAYVFDLNGTLLDTLASPAPRPGDQFGAAVALLGNTAVVGAWLDDTGVDNAGAVFQFVDVSVPTTSSTSTTSTSSTSTSVTTTTSGTSTTETTTTTTTTETFESTTTTTTTTETFETTTTTTTVTITATTLTPTDSTTTTVVSSGGSNRSTTTVPTCATGCDDDDPCTVDTCLPPDACTNEPITGFDGAVCRLDLLDAALHGPPVAGRQLTARLQRKLARARNLVEAARGRTTKRTVGRADKALTAFINLLKRSQRTGRIAYAVAADLLALSTEAATQLAPLR